MGWRKSMKRKRKVKEEKEEEDVIDKEKIKEAIEIKKDMDMFW